MEGPTLGGSGHGHSPERERERKTQPRPQGPGKLPASPAGGRDPPQRHTVPKGWPPKGSYLVDPASSHMLVSKIKPCMCKYERYTVKLRMAH